MLVFEQVFCRPTEYSVPSRKASCQPTEYSSPSSHDQSLPGKVMLVLEQVFCRPTECSHQSWRTFCRPSEYSLQSWQAFCWPLECSIRKISEFIPQEFLFAPKKSVSPLFIYSVSLNLYYFLSLNKVSCARIRRVYVYLCEARSPQVTERARDNRIKK